MVLSRRLVGFVVRRLRPQWVYDRVEAVLGHFERFGPVEHLSLPAGHLLCVVAPHPDDESIGCGGLIALWSAAGRPVQVVFLTKGESGSRKVRDPRLPQAEREASARALREIRSAEAEAALDILGAAAIWFDGIDGALYRNESQLASRLAELWRTDPPPS